MRVFVYGTLRRGECNHRRLATAQFLGEAVSIGNNFWLTGRGVVPFLSEARESEGPQRRRYMGAIRGELYAVDADTFASLDRLEGHPDFYRRELRRFKTLNGRKTFTAWVYLAPHASNCREAPHEPDAAGQLEHRKFPLQPYENAAE